MHLCEELLGWNENLQLHGPLWNSLDTYDILSQFLVYYSETLWPDFHEVCSGLSHLHLGGRNFTGTSRDMTDCVNKV